MRIFCRVEGPVSGYENNDYIRCLTSSSGIPVKFAISGIDIPFFFMFRRMVVIPSVLPSTLPAA
jgi:hypothetical protein